MQATISSVATFLEHNALLAIVATLLAAASESIVLVGAFVPGTALILALGAAAGLGYLPLWPLILAATAGAIVGDGVSYWIGHAHRRSIAATWPFSTNKDLLQAGETFFGKYGWAGIAIARFLPGVRAIVPVVAGTSGMKPLPFYVANIGSAIVWAPAHLVPAALAGAGLKGMDLRAELIVLIVGGLLGLTLWLIWRHYPGLVRAVANGVDRLSKQFLSSRSESSDIRSGDSAPSHADAARNEPSEARGEDQP